MSTADIQGRATIAVAGGKTKIDAIRGVLASGLLRGLITDENTARSSRGEPIIADVMRKETKEEAMHDKAKEFFAAFKAGQISRRELMSGAAKLGVSVATANFLLNAAATRRWRRISTGRNLRARSCTFF